MKRYPTILIGILLALAATAQTGGRPVTLSAGVEAGIPIGEFEDSWGREIFGFSGNLTMPMRLLPFDWGVDFAWGRMGGESKEVTVNEEYLEVTTGDLRVHSDIFGYHGLLRLKPFNGKVSPYIEGLAGVRQFTTRTVIDVDGLDAPLFEERNANEFIWSHGWAAGVQVAPGKNFYLELRVEQLNGGQVEYVDPNSITIGDDGLVEFGTLHSGVRVVNIHAGIGLRF